MGQTLYGYNLLPPVVTPTFVDYVTIMILHPNGDTLKNIKVGDIFKRGEPIFLECNDGNATGYHFHISVSKGKYVSPGWRQNSLNGSVITGEPQKPEDVFYIDKNFTQVVNTRGLVFKYLEKSYGVSVERDTLKEQLQIVDTIKLYDLNNKELGLLKKGIYNYILENGIDYKVEYEEGKYGYIDITNENTIILDKEEIKEKPVEEEVTPIAKISIFTRIKNFFVKIFNKIRNLFVK